MSDAPAIGSWVEPKHPTQSPTGPRRLSHRVIAVRRGREEAELLRELLAQARDCSRIIVATHVPPFVEACWHEGKISSADWLPHFACVAVGDVLREFVVAHPDTNIEVYCGHTHGEGVARILPNLVVHTGGAEYVAPVAQRMIAI